MVGRYVSSFLAEKLAFEIGTDSSRLPHETLSDREFQVLRLIAAGKSVTEIAAELSLSVKTVSTYRARLLTEDESGNQRGVDALCHAKPLD